MDMNVLKYMAFVQTAECGSFTLAGEMLHCSQSGVSRMIRDLEREWGVELLERRRSGVHLTSDGANLLPYAQSLCGEYRKLQMRVDDLHGLQSGTIRIGTVSSFATHWLPRIIRAFRSDYPGIDYELLMGDYTEIDAWIHQGRVDCGFMTLPVSQDLETIELARDRLLAILPPDHKLAREERVPLSGLCEDPFLLLEKGAKSGVTTLFEREGLTPRVCFRTWDDYAILSMVENGLGVSIVPELILKRAPYNVAVRELESRPVRTVVFALRSRESASLATQRFIDYLGYRNESEEGEG